MCIRDRFIESYINWAKDKGYNQSQDKAAKIYMLAKEGIPTVSSDTPSTKMLVQEAVRVLREVDNTLMTILTPVSYTHLDVYKRQLFHCLQDI